MSWSQTQNGVENASAGVCHNGLAYDCRANPRCTLRSVQWSTLRGRCADSHSLSWWMDCTVVTCSSLCAQIVISMQVSIHDWTDKSAPPECEARADCIKEGSLLLWESMALGKRHDRDRLSSEQQQRARCRGSRRRARTDYASRHLCAVWHAHGRRTRIASRVSASGRDSKAFRQELAPAGA